MCTSAEHDSSETNLSARIGILGYRYVGETWYKGSDWFMFEFPNTPSKLYVFKPEMEWGNKLYSRVRFSHEGSVDYWQSGTDESWWHTKIAFSSLKCDVPAIEVDFRSHGQSNRGEGENFDYSETEVRRCYDIEKTDFEVDLGHFRSHTSDLASPMSYENIVETVASLALRYPYFTWDMAGTYDKIAVGGQDSSIRECHCRIFTEKLLKLVAPELSAEINHGANSHTLATTPISAPRHSLDSSCRRRRERTGCIRECLGFMCSVPFIMPFGRVHSQPTQYLCCGDTCASS